MLTLALIAIPACTQSQVHPSKAVYGDWETWPVSTPADVRFAEGFRPFRAVWSREYRNMQGEMRTDRVILVAEELSWYGSPTLSLTFHDAGALDAPDTNARTTSVYVDKGTLSLIRATAPKAGTAEDYNVVAVGDGMISTTSVETATGASEHVEFPTDGPVFGGFNLDFLVWAGLDLDLETGAVMHFYNPSANTTVPSIIRVVAREEVELPGGDSATAWVIERPIPQPDNARMHHFRVLDRPPYLVSRHVVDLDSGETSFHQRLLEWRWLTEE